MIVASVVVAPFDQETTTITGVRRPRAKLYQCNIGPVIVLLLTLFLALLVVVASIAIRCTCAKLRAYRTRPARHTGFPPRVLAHYVHARAHQALVKMRRRGHRLMSGNSSNNMARMTDANR